MRDHARLTENGTGHIWLCAIYGKKKKNEKICNVQSMEKREKIYNVQACCKV